MVRGCTAPPLPCCLGSPLTNLSFFILRISLAQTTCNIAIKAWVRSPPGPTPSPCPPVDSLTTLTLLLPPVSQEAKNEAVAEDAEEVKLYCQIPPIQKMDNSLNTLKSCKWVLPPQPPPPQPCLAHPRQPLRH